MNDYIKELLEHWIDAMDYCMKMQKQFKHFNEKEMKDLDKFLNEMKNFYKEKMNERNT